MLTFESSLPRSIASKTSRYSSSTTRSASSSSSPAMYRDEIRRTTGLGTAGSRRTIAESTRLTARESLRACLLAALELAHQAPQQRVQLLLLVVAQCGRD